MVRRYGPCAPYPTIAVIMRGPRSRAGLMAYPDPYQLHQLIWLIVVAAGLTGLHPKCCSNSQDGDEDDQGDEADMQPAVALIGDGKYDKNEDECANELGDGR
jgi:hypothetical protein